MTAFGRPRSDRETSYRAVVVLVVCVLAPLLAMQVQRLIGHTGGDFRIYHMAASRFLADRLSLYDISSAQALVGFIYPPTAILLFVPFTRLGLHQAYGLFAGLTYLLMTAIVIGWVRTIGRSLRGPRALGRAETLMLILVGLTAGPVFTTVAHGQVDVPVLGICTLHVMLRLARRSGLSGMVIAIGCWIKFYPALLLVWSFRIPRRRPMLLGFAITLAAVPALALLVQPANLFLTYFRDMLPQLSGRTITNVDNQSAITFLMRFTDMPDPFVDSFAAFPSSNVARSSVLGAGCALVLGTLIFVRGTPHRDVLAACMVIAIIGPLAPLGWGHTYVYMLPLLLATLITGLIGRSSIHLAAATSAYAATVIPSHHHFEAFRVIPLFAQNMLYSRYLLATLLLLAVNLLLPDRGPRWRTASDRPLLDHGDAA